MNLAADETRIEHGCAEIFIRVSPVFHPWPKYFFLFVPFCAFSWLSPLAAAVMSLDDIELWVGTGENRAAMVIDWDEALGAGPSLVWGYRWDGDAYGGQMLAAIVAADSRLYAKLAGAVANPGVVYGLGYDTNDDGQFALTDGTMFDDAGMAFVNPADGETSIDPADDYAEGWFTGYWHYGNADSNPYAAGGAWIDAPRGMSQRPLVDGAWDSWTFTATFDANAFPDLPEPAPPPMMPGDFDGNGVVDAADYTIWRDGLGGAFRPEHYAEWTNNFGAGASAATAAIPEPSSWMLWILILFTPRWRLLKGERS